MTSEALVVLVGVDTLVVNARSVVQGDREEQSKEESRYHVPLDDVLPDHLTEPLGLWLEMAKNASEPVMTTWMHEARNLLLYPHGTPTHRYLLKNGFIDLMLGPLLNHGAPTRVRFSRATKWRPVKQSQLDKPIYRYHELETLQFSGHGNPISVTIYDKRAEIEFQSREKRWFYDLWKQRGWDGAAPVWRVECRLKREALHEMDLEEAYGALDQVPALWAYCVGQPGQKNGWVRMVDPSTRDTNRRRWNTASNWVAVQKAFMQHWRTGEDVEAIQRERKRQINLDRAEKAIAGYTTTYAAWLQHELGSEDDASIVLQRLYEKMLSYWQRQGTDFQAQRRKKEFLYHIS